MKENFRSRLKVFIPAFNVYPLASAQRWADNYYGQVRHISGHRRKAVHTQAQFREKVAQPLLDKLSQMINPDLVSKSDLGAKDIVLKHQANLLRQPAAKNYLAGLDAAYRRVDGIPAKYIKEQLPYGAARYAEKMTFGTWRLIGSLAPGSLAASDIITGWLLGELQTTKLLRKEDELLHGQPISIISDQTRPGLFKVKLRARLQRALAHITELNYHPEKIKKENDKINQLVNGFCRPDLSPFTLNGASHLDFVIHPETAELLRSPRLTRIRDNIYQYFLKESFIPSQPEVLPEGEKPADYIGSPLKYVCLDMHLDIQVTTKL